MNPTIDTSSFPVGRDIDYESEEEVARLNELKDEARRFVMSFRWAPAIADMVLAFGVAPILSLFLIRFAQGLAGEGRGDTELWVVVGDLPSIYFETEEARSPSAALQLYCAIAQDWADSVLARRDLSDCYPIEVAPTREHAEMLKGRIETIRESFLPLM